MSNILDQGYFRRRNELANNGGFFNHDSTEIPSMEVPLDLEAERLLVEAGFDGTVFAGTIFERKYYPGGYQTVYDGK